jgi:hypothetical protein
LRKDVVAASQTPFIEVLAQSLKGGVPQCLGDKKERRSMQDAQYFLGRIRNFTGAQPPTPQDFKC